MTTIYTRQKIKDIEQAKKCKSEDGTHSWGIDGYCPDCDRTLGDIGMLDAMIEDILCNDE